jgi:hypothetical protein
MSLMLSPVLLTAAQANKNFEITEVKRGTCT